MLQASYVVPLGAIGDGETMLISIRRPNRLGGALFHFRNLIRTVAIPFVVGLLSPVAGATSANLPEPVQKVLLRHKVPERSLSVFVQDVRSTEPLLSVTADVPRNPASAIKLLTTLVALHELGPGFSWRTTALTTGSLRNGHLDGDLYLRGEGDPFLVTERFWKFLLELRQSGLETHRWRSGCRQQLFRGAGGRPGCFRWQTVSAVQCAAFGDPGELWRNPILAGAKPRRG